MILTTLSVAPLALAGLTMKKKVACAALVGAAGFGLGVLAAGAAMGACRKMSERRGYHPHPSAAEPDAPEVQA